jgi:hypothetical protein
MVVEGRKRMMLLSDRGQRRDERVVKFARFGTKTMQDDASALQDGEMLIGDRLVSEGEVRLQR